MKYVTLICSIPLFTGILANAQPVSGSPPPNGAGIYQVGQGVSTPRIVFKTEPQYTEEASRAGVQSMVLTMIVVRADGVPTSIRVLRGAGFGLDEKAIEAIEAWHFTPAMKENRPVAVTATIEVNFRLLSMDHENQITRLNFTLPAGASRPELKFGDLPANSPTLGDQSVRIRLQVDADGRTRNLTVLESTDENWEKATLGKLRLWRFQPSMLQGRAVEAEGVFELTHGRERPSAPQ